MNPAALSVATLNAVPARERIVPGLVPRTLATTSAFVWPAPPFFRPSAAPADRGRECVVEFLDGRSEAGELVAIGPDDCRAQFRARGREALAPLDLDEVRSIRLRPFAFVPDAYTLQQIGANGATIKDEREFEIAFPDGTRITGTTRGFLKAHGGLFLYSTEGANSALTITRFIPRTQTKDVRIGRPLGDILQEKGLVSGEELSAALLQQSRLRHRRLGEYLADHAIVSAEDLTRAIEDQVRRPNVRLGDLLIEAELLSPEDLRTALAIQARNRERRLGDILVSMGVVSQRLIQVALSEKLGTPQVSARQFPIEPATLALVNEAFAVRHQVLPLLRRGDALVVAVENPLALDFERDLRFTTGLTIIPVIADPEELRSRIAREYLAATAGPAGGDAAPADRADVHADEHVNRLAHKTRQAKPQARPRDAEVRVTDNALATLVNKIIVDAHAQGASDIHIESNPGDGTTHIRFRRDGHLREYLQLQPTYRNALVSRIKIMAGLDISERRRAQDGTISFRRFGPVAIELRVAVIPTCESQEDVVLHILGNAKPIALDRMGLSRRDLDELRTMISRRYGLFLVCGPTGSGTTTTLHSVLRHINRPDVKIWTAEDPIEIVQPGLRQVQVDPKIDWTFAAATRAFLRADPDVIMVGEMRDAETARIGIEASLTGHLVLSTLHTNSAAESVVRLLDLGMDPFNFADALVGVLSQRLARRLCPHCRKPRVATDTELNDLAHEYCDSTALDPRGVLEEWRLQHAHGGSLVLHDPVGCANCGGDGYKGRVGLFELLVATPAVKQLARSRGTAPQLVAAARDGGMRPLRQDAIERVLKGDLDLAGARAAAT